MEYDNFLIKLYKSTTEDVRYQAQVLTPASADGGRFDLPLTATQLEEMRSKSASLVGYAKFGKTFVRGLGYVPAHDIVRSLSRQMYESLPASVRQALRVSLARALQRRRGLRIGLLIDSTAGELAELPWEMLWDPNWSTGFLAQSPLAPVVRLATTSLPPQDWLTDANTAIRSNSGELFALAVPTHPTPPRRILVALVGAVEELRVAGAERELEWISAAVAQVAQVDRLDPVTLAGLEAKLSQEAYQTLHIITHGPAANSPDFAHLLFDAPSTPGAVPLPDRDLVSGARLLGVLQGHPSLEMIVFSSCRSALANEQLATMSGGTEARSLGKPFLSNSLGAIIAAGTGLPVVAMQFDIRAPSETPSGEPTRSWASAFYREIARGGAVELAVTAARRALNVDKDPVLWAAPALFVPFYWTPPPAALPERLDRLVYGAVANSMRGNGQLLYEGTVLLGLLIVAALVMADLLAAPPDGAAVLRAAYSLFLTVAILPALVAGAGVVMAARHDPASASVRGRLALRILLTAYAGAGLGMIGVLFVAAIIALSLYHIGTAYPILADLLRPLLAALTVGMGVVQSLVFAGRTVRVGQSVADAPQIYDLGLLVGLSPVILGAAFALTMPLWYGWFLATPAYLLVVGATLIVGALLMLRTAAINRP